MANLLACKPMHTLMQEAPDTSEHALKRTLGPVNLVMLGIGRSSVPVCSSGRPPPLRIVPARR